jgi:NAD(P)-dependent dehydrogenase (short-subunit alcohol dehydrogenase family)
MGDFQDRHVVVTGGAGALGIAVVQALIDAGAACHVLYHSPDEAERFPLKDRAGVDLIGPVDLTDESAVTAFYQSVPKLWASIHLAGGFATKPAAETGKADLMRMIDMNLVTCQLCCAASIRALRGTGQGGRIVNVAARAALEPRSGAGSAAYAAAKAAVAALTEALAEEVAKDGILVNAVAPSIMDTPANRQAMPKADHAAWPKVAEVAATICFLAAPANRVTRGAIIPVYGRV